MAQRVRRRAVGQAERAAHPLPSPVARCAATAARPSRRRTAARRALAHRGRARDSPRSPCAPARSPARSAVFCPCRHGDGSRLADRRVGPANRQRLADAQARAVAERQHRGVARQHPGLARFAFAGLVVVDGAGVRRRSSGRGRRRAALGARTAPSAARPPAFARDVARERAQAGERALQRAAARRPPRAPARERRAGRRARNRRSRRSQRRAEALAEEGEELARVAAVSLDRLVRQAPLAARLAKPGDAGRGEVGRGGEGDESARSAGYGMGKDYCARRVKRTLQGGRERAIFDRSN